MLSWSDITNAVRKDRAIDRAVRYWSSDRAQSRLKYSAVVLGDVVVNAANTVTLHQIDSLNKLASQGDAAIAHARREACLEGTWNADLVENVIAPVVEEAMVWAAGEAVVGVVGKASQVVRTSRSAQRLTRAVSQSRRLSKAASLAGKTANVASKAGLVAGTGTLAYDAANNIGNGVERIQNGDTWGGVQDIIRGGFRAAEVTRVVHGVAGATRPSQSAPSDVDDYISGLSKRRTPSNTDANLYEIRHTGEWNYQVRGGGETFDIDGYQNTVILEAKYVGNPSRSPFVPGSGAPDFIRQGILDQVDDELRRMQVIINDPANPFESAEIITNDPRSLKLFKQMMRARGLKPSVKLKK